MALIACTECNKQISDKAASCPSCGAPVSSREPIVNRWSEEPKKEKSSVWKWVLGVPVGGFILMMIVGSCAGNSPEGKERQSSRDAISFCWEQQSKKSLDPSTARFAASTCEKMESDYRARWGRNP